MDKDTSSPGILHRGAFIYYVGSVVFAAGIALLAVGTAFVMIFRIHHGSEPEKIILCLIFTGVGTTLILTGINLMMRQTQYGYYIIGASAFISVLALLIFTSNYPHNWHYPLISYILALYVIGFLMLLGNAFANVILWMIEGKTEAVVGRGEEIKLYTNEEIERDIEEATRKSIELSASELEFKEPSEMEVRLGTVFRETRGNTTRVKDDIREAKSLRKTIRPGERLKSGSVEVESISRNLGDILRKGAVEKGRFGRIREKLKGEVKKLWKGKMKIATIIVLVVIVLFILLPILSGNAPFPTNISATEIGHFIGGFTGYWINALKSVFASLQDLFWKGCVELRSAQIGKWTF